MRYQPWVSASDWEKTDPKLMQAASQPIQLKHTVDLVDAIPITPAGIVIVRGPRQTGKSTFLRQFVRKCIKNGTKAPAIVLFDAERFTDRHQLLGELEMYLQEQANGYCVVLIDEITSIDKWWLSLKTLADDGTSANALIIATGSSIIDLTTGADLMPGRRGKRHPVDFELLPAPYRMVSGHLTLREYALTGGLPWAINEYLRLHTIPDYVYELYAAWIKGAFHKQRHQADRLPFLLNHITQHCGTPVSVQKLARDCGFGSNQTAEIFISLLENMYAVIPAYWVPPQGGAPAPRKNRKLYPFDPFLFHLFSDFGKASELSYQEAAKRLDDPKIMGAMAEGIVAAELRRRKGAMHLGYWLGNREIDFIDTELVEVKYQNHVAVDEFSWALKVLPKNAALTVITKKDNARAEKISLIDLERWLKTA